MTVKNRVFIGLGSNLGEGLQVLLTAWREIGKKNVELIRISRPYLSAPVDMVSENWFTNAVGEVYTDYTPNQILETLLGLEKELGRTRKKNAVGYQDRVLDLDILLFNNLVSEEIVLTLPHPEMNKRLFVLTPFAEIAPEVIHSSSGKSIRSLEKELLQKIDKKIVQPQSIRPAKWP